ncbi:MAG TPA: hypothetical protein PLG56_09495 [Lacunisphaera sp.]|nr:hypothetical protein [Lacunisphaera sp.]
MSQEDTKLNTQNTTGGLFGSLFGGLTDLIKGAAPVATNLYTLKLQGDQLSQNILSQQQLIELQRQQEAAKANGTAVAPGWYQPWMLWVGGGLVVALIALLIARRR